MALPEKWYKKWRSVYLPLLAAAGLVGVVIFSSQSAATGAIAALTSANADLTIAEGDVYLEPGDGGYNLYIRKKADINSVLITESTKDPAGKLDNYSFRALDYNAVNGNEKRLLNGAFIENPTFALIDSTPEANVKFGQAFHIFIPYTIVYGSDATRNGEVYVKEGTWINLRSFAKAYADYTGNFKENPFRFEYVQTAYIPEPETPPPVSVPALKEEPEPGISYPKDTATAFSQISQKGDTLYAASADAMIESIAKILEGHKGYDLDLVICLDATASMKLHMDAIKQQLPELIKRTISNYPSFRIGMVLYKDYYDDYLNKIIPFTPNPDVLYNNIKSLKTSGGLDIPEAVYEALYAGALGFDWEAPDRLMILIGDAPPHPTPQGDITAAMVEAETAKLGITVSTITLPAKR